jgi:hypothetical protein
MATWRLLLVVTLALAGCRSSEPAKRASAPEPGATSISLVEPNAVLSAVFYYAWWHEPMDCGPESANKWCCSWSGKQGDGPSVARPRPPRPIAGLYSSDDQGVVHRHMDWLVDYGVDVVALEWDGDPLERLTLENVVIPTIGERDLQFVLLYDMGVRLKLRPDGTVDFDDPENRDRLVADFAKFASSATYFGHPSYLRLRNRPVVYVYISRAMIGAATNIRSAFDAAHEAARRAGFDGLYLVADHLIPDGTPYATLDLMGARAVSSVAPIGFANVNGERPVRAWADLLAEEIYRPALQALPEMGRIDLMPGVFVQYDDTGISACGLHDRTTFRAYHLEDGSDWRYMLQTTLPFARVAEETTVDQQGTVTVSRNTDVSIVWIYSFNEWGEGAGLEPLEVRTPRYPFGFGFDLLQIFEDVMGAQAANRRAAHPRRASAPRARGLPGACARGCVSSARRAPAPPPDPG